MNRWVNRGAKGIALLDDTERPAESQKCLHQWHPIWIYWNKGIEQAPIIIQKCYESVCKHSNQKIILLNDQNLADYIRLPDYIEKKKDAGQIPMAGYT